MTWYKYSFLCPSGEISKITAAVHIRASMKINIKHKNNTKELNTKYTGGIIVYLIIMESLLFI